MTNSIRDIAEESQCFFIIGCNTTEQHPVIGTKIRRAVRQRGAKLIVADPRRIDIADYADLHLQHKPGTDIALLNGLMHVILREGWQDEAFIAERTEGFEEFKAVVEKYTPEVASEITGVPAEDIEKAARMLAENRPGSLLYAMGITQHTVGVANVMSCANLQMLLGNMGVPGGGVNPLRGQNNVQGACDLGGLPNVYPGYQRGDRSRPSRRSSRRPGACPCRTEMGLTVTEMLDAAEAGHVRCLYVIGENPMISDPDLNHVRDALQETEFLVVQDIFLTETGQLADVVFPAASFAEKDGTFTNTERRVQRCARPSSRPARPSPTALDHHRAGQADDRPGRGIARPGSALRRLGLCLRRRRDGRDQRADAHLCRRHLRAAGAGEQLQWPCPRRTIPARRFLHVGKFSRGVGRFAAVDHVPPAELPDDEYPLMLTTGRVLYHWHGGEMTRRARGLDAMYPEALVEINPEDAERLGIGDGQLIKVASRRGEIVAKAEVTDRVQPGVGLLHLPLSRVGGQLPHQPGAGPGGQDPRVQGVRRAGRVA